MTMIEVEGLLPSAEQITRAKALRKASVLIDTHGEPGPTRVAGSGGYAEATARAMTIAIAHRGVCGFRSRVD